MNIRSILNCLLTALAVAVSAASAQAAEKVAGPNGGRILEGLEPRAEFFVMPDRKVQITFLDPSGKAIAPAQQSVTVISGERSAPRTLTFSKVGDTLVSNVAIPDGDLVPTVVQIKPTAGAPAVTERFNVNLETCSVCKLAEYACICSH